jgi:Uma2 family endonuclease
MTARIIEKATYDDLMRVPDIMVAELIDGELYAWPRPSGKHARVSSRLGMKLGSAYDLGDSGPGGWWLIDEPELHFGENVLVPDLGGWRRERMPEYPEASGCTVAPDWLCEVLSPSTGKIDRGKKLPIYAREGVQYAWIVDPLQETIEIKHLENGRWSDLAIFAGNDVVRAEPFPEIEFSASIFWSSPLPTP